MERERDVCVLEVARAAQWIRDGQQADLDRNSSRDIQQTDSDGVTQFSTLFPNQYSVRAPLMHVASHLDATAVPIRTM